MISENDLTDGQAITFRRPVGQRLYNGTADFSYGEQKDGFIRIQEWFCETQDFGNTFYVPAEFVKLL